MRREGVESVSLAGLLKESIERVLVGCVIGYKFALVCH